MRRPLKHSWKLIEKNELVWTTGTDFVFRVAHGASKYEHMKTLTIESKVAGVPPIDQYIRIHPTYETYIRKTLEGPPSSDEFHESFLYDLAMLRLPRKQKI